MFTQNSVTIITAATGNQALPVCLQSVQAQTFPDVQHLVVIDGLERDVAVRSVLERYPPASKQRDVVTLPAATGKLNWNGHRIYAAMSFLVNTEFVCYLDEDNWFDPDHVETLVAAVRSTPNGRWAFSLRKIVDADGRFIADDKCESLGNLHHVFNNPQDVHIDANCYLLGREIAVGCSPIWYAPGYVPNVRDPDRTCCRELLEFFQPASSNRKHTVNYRVGNQARSVQARFFLFGNAKMKRVYPNGLPWETPSP